MKDFAKQIQQTGARNSGYFGRMLGSGDSTDRKLWQLTEMVTESNGPRFQVKARQAYSKQGALHHKLVVVLTIISTTVSRKPKDEFLGY